MLFGSNVCLIERITCTAEAPVSETNASILRHYKVISSDYSKLCFSFSRLARVAHACNLATFLIFISVFNRRKMLSVITM